MKKSRYTESLIVKSLKEVDADQKVSDVCREYGIADTTYYNWKPYMVVWKTRISSD